MGELFSGRDLAKAMMTGQISRRALNKALLSIGLVAVSAPLAGRRARAESPDISVFTWSGYDKPAQHQKFIDQYGASPEFSIFADNDEGLAKIKAGFDPSIAVPSNSEVPNWVRAGILEPVAVERLKNWPDVFEELKSDPSTMGKNGERVFVPWMWGNTSITFRTDMAPEYVQNPSWNMLWDPKYKGKLALRDNWNGASIPAGLVLGVENPFSPTDAEIEKIGEKIREQRPLAKLYWSSDTDAVQAMASGEVAAMYSFNTSYAALKKQGIPVAFMVPKEGLLTWADGFVIIKNGKGSEKQKYDFLDASLDPEVGKYNIEKVSAGSSNRKAFEIADPGIVASLGLSDPQAVMKASLWYKPVPPETRQKLIEMYNRVKGGL